MSGVVKKIVDKVANGLGYAMAGGEAAVMQGGVAGDEDRGSVVKQLSGSLADALLRGEQTQQVKQLAIHSARMTEIMTNYKMFGDGAMGMIVPREKPTVDESEEGCEVVLVQDVKVIPASAGKAIGGQQAESFFDVTRDSIPRFRLEQFVTRAVVKVLKGGGHQLDLYVRKPMADGELGRGVGVEPRWDVVWDDVSEEDRAYIEDYAPIDKWEMTKRRFGKEVERALVSGNRRVDFAEFDKLSFSTNSAYGADDASVTVLKYREFLGVFEFRYEVDGVMRDSGMYVLKYRVEAEELAVRLSDRLMEEWEMQDEVKKFEGKTPRNPNQVASKTYSMMDDLLKCEVCGRYITMVYDEATGEPVVDDQTGEPMRHELAVADYKLTKREYGVGMCAACLLKREVV